MIVTPAMVDDFDKFNRFNIDVTEQLVGAYTIARLSPVSQHPLLIPIREECLKLAWKMMLLNKERGKSSINNMTSLRGLWNVLNSRFHTVKHGDMTRFGVRKLPEAHEYYMNQRVGMWGENYEDYSRTRVCFLTCPLRSDQWTDRSQGARSRPYHFYSPFWLHC